MDRRGTVWAGLALVVLVVAIGCNSGGTVSPAETQANFIDPAEKSGAFLHPNAMPKASAAKAKTDEPAKDAKTEP